MLWNNYSFPVLLQSLWCFCTKKSTDDEYSKYLEDLDKFKIDTDLQSIVESIRTLKSQVNNIINLKLAPRYSINNQI